jgi:hypothetical protein
VLSVEVSAKISEKKYLVNEEALTQQGLLRPKIERNLRNTSVTLKAFILYHMWL